MHPFLDVTKLKDEEILDRLSKAYAYLSYQTSLGHTATVASIKEIIDDLEAENHNRMQRNMESEYVKKFPDHLAPVEIGKCDKVDIEEYIRKAL